MAIQDTVKEQPSVLVRKKPPPGGAMKPSADAHWQIHRNRKRAILQEFPHVQKLYGHDSRTQFYAYALILLQLGLAWSCRNSYIGAIALSVLVGPFVDNGVLCFMHEATHFLVFRNAGYNRILSLLANSVMLIPISEIFRQHHHKHHQKLGNDSFDVDVPTPAEIRWVGNSAPRKALWLTFNMIILPVRSMFRLPVDIDAYLIANWIVCLGLGAASLFYSPPSFVFLIMSALNSQGFHPANTRQVQRHIYNGDEKMVSANGEERPGTYSYYGPVNLLTLNVGYHVEHHDFCSIPWTKLPALRRIAGEKWYPTPAAHTGRGLSELLNFVLNENITLSDFAHE